MRVILVRVTAFDLMAAINPFGPLPLKRTSLVWGRMAGTGGNLIASTRFKSSSNKQLRNSQVTIDPENSGIRKRICSIEDYSALGHPAILSLNDYT